MSTDHLINVTGRVKQKSTFTMVPDVLTRPTAYDYTPVTNYITLPAAHSSQQQKRKPYERDKQACHISYKIDEIFVNIYKFIHKWHFTTEHTNTQYVYEHAKTIYREQLRNQRITRQQPTATSSFKTSPACAYNSTNIISVHSLLQLVI